MTRRERRWAQAILEGFSPPAAEGGTEREALVPRPGQIDYAGAYAVWVGAAGPVGRVGLRLALALINLSPWWAFRRPRTLARLPAPARAVLLDRLLAHRRSVVRDLAWTLKLAAATALFADASIRERSGFDRIPARPERRRLELTA